MQTEEVKRLQKTTQSQDLEIQKLKDQLIEQSAKYESRLNSQTKQISNLSQDLEKSKTELANIKLELANKTKEFEEQMTKNETTNKNLSKMKEKHVEILDSDTMKKFEKVKELGRGGSGIVYEVIKTEIIKQSYVLKELSQLEQSKLQSFMREYEILNILNHPNVLKTYGIFLSDETIPPSILLEYCPCDIGKMIKNESLSNVEIAFAIYQIAEGMKYIHFQKIIHRDLKPSNILVDSDGTIKICDFGISKVMSSEELELSMTKGLGTLFFMAPEILNEEGYNEKIDVYSFGVLIYFILSGGEMPKITIIQIGSGKKAKIPSSFTEFAKDLINSCWNTDPESRPSFQNIVEKLNKNAHKLLDLSSSEIHEIQSKIKQFKKQIPFYSS